MPPAPRRHTAALLPCCRSSPPFPIHKHTHARTHARTHMPSSARLTAPSPRPIAHTADAGRLVTFSDVAEQTEARARREKGAGGRAGGRAVGTARRKGGATEGQREWQRAQSRFDRGSIVQRGWGCSVDARDAPWGEEEARCHPPRRSRTARGKSLIALQRSAPSWTRSAWLAANRQRALLPGEQTIDAKD